MYLFRNIAEVFMEDYREGTEYLELKNKMKPIIKLKNASESMDDKIERLKARGYISACSIEVGEFL